MSWANEVAINNSCDKKMAGRYGIYSIFGVMGSHEIQRSIGASRIKIGVLGRNKYIEFMTAPVGFDVLISLDASLRSSGYYINNCELENCDCVTNNIRAENLYGVTGKTKLNIPSELRSKAKEIFGYDELDVRLSACRVNIYGEGTYKTRANDILKVIDSKYKIDNSYNIDEKHKKSAIRIVTTSECNFVIKDDTVTMVFEKFNTNMCDRFIKGLKKIGYYVTVSNNLVLM